MVTGRIFIRNIDYHTIMNAVMPYIAKGLTDKKSIFTKVFKNIISRQGKPTGFTNLLISIVPDKNHAAAAILPHFNEDMIKALNELLREKRIIANLKTIDFKSMERSSGKMLMLEITLDDIDYEQTAVNFVPMLLDKLSQQDGNAGKAAGFLLKQGELSENVLRAAIGAIPVSQRDELAAEILSEYRKEIIGALSDIIIRYHLKAEIKDIKIKNS